MYVGGEFACCHVMNFKFAVQLVSLTTDALAFSLYGLKLHNFLDFNIC